MNYYSQILNAPGCTCRPWPLLPAAEADDEIARLLERIAQLESKVRSLIAANLELQEIVNRRIKR
jgi:hypothetical protein